MALLPIIETFYFHNNGTKVSGEAANLKIRYLADSYAANLPLTIAEEGTTGVYKISGFGDTGVASYYADCKLYWNGVAQPAFGVRDLGDPSERFLDKTTTSSQTMAGPIAMGSNKITGLAAGTTSGDAVRWEQVMLTTGTQTVAGQKIFDSTGSVVPTITAPSTTGLPTATGHFVSKYYADALFAASTGSPQSTYMIKLLPTRSTEDTLSKMTVEACKTYLVGLTSIASIRGSIEIDSLGITDNAINLDDGATVWTADGVDINAKNKCVFTRRAPNDSITADSRIRNIHFHDLSVVATRTYVNFTFDNCDFTSTGTAMVFNNCKFRGTCAMKITTGSLTFQNCKGPGTVVYNDDVTPTITGTQPADIKGIDVLNLGF